MRRVALFAMAIALLVAACTDGVSRDGGRGGALEPFGTEEDLVAYLETLPAGSHGVPGGEGEAASDTAGVAAAPAPTNESITNVQEQGVDEGDIVKNVGDSLLVLRQGRLYAVSVAVPGTPVQTGSVRVAASEALNDGVWYDEMLVDGDRVYVIGYRYDLAGVGPQAESEVPELAWNGATEVNVFRLRDGGFERLGSTFVESWDYFSSDNYASRLVDGRLVFYMPFSAWLRESDGEPAFPRLLAAGPDGRFEALGPLFAADDVYRPLEKPEMPVFHSLVTCDLGEDGSVDCAAKSLLGDVSREFYVSPTDVFLWSNDHVYEFEIATQTVLAHTVTGIPFDQFAFRQDGETLHVATLDGAGTLSMLTLDLGRFDTEGAQSLDGLARVLHEGSFGEGGWSGVTAERYAGDTFVAAVGGTPNAVVIHDLASGETATVDPGFPVGRIEALGSDRVLVAGSGSGVAASFEMRVLDLPAKGSTVGAVSLPSSGEGESRSHGFFFRPSSDGTRGQAGEGTFGIPVVQEVPADRETPAVSDGSGAEEAGSEVTWWGSGISNVAFVAVGADGAMSPLGVVSATGDAGVCETSCVDWYGNTRPIFLGDRVFALMGSELVEVTLEPEVTRSGAAVSLTRT